MAITDKVVLYKTGKFFQVSKACITLKHWNKKLIVHIWLSNQGNSIIYIKCFTDLLICENITATTSLPVDILSIRSVLCGSILYSNGYYTVLATCSSFLVSAASYNTICGVKLVRSWDYSQQSAILSTVTVLIRYAHVLICIFVNEGSWHFSAFISISNILWQIRFFGQAILWMPDSLRQYMPGNTSITSSKILRQRSSSCH